MKNALNFNSRIVGGSEAESPIPWQVTVSNCGGTILDEYTILSAAHCTAYRNDLVQTGEPGVPADPPTQSMRVKEVIRHPKYNNKTNEFDYSILKLREPITFNKYAKPACLPKSANFYIGHSALASGFGKEKHRKFVLDIFDNSKFSI